VAEKLILNVALLFLGALAVRWVALRLLYRFAPEWAVGPGGFLIDTRGRLGIFQMRQGNIHSHGGDGDASGGGGGCDQGRHPGTSALTAVAAARSLRTSSSSDWKST
jgi:hypothetical protein